MGRQGDRAKRREHDLISLSPRRPLSPSHLREFSCAFVDEHFNYFSKARNSFRIRAVMPQIGPCGEGYAGYLMIVS